MTPLPPECAPALCALLPYVSAHVLTASCGAGADEHGADEWFGGSKGGYYWNKNPVGGNNVDATPICVRSAEGAECCTGDCVPVAYRFDGDDDCGDNSDEAGLCGFFIGQFRVDFCASLTFAVMRME